MTILIVDDDEVAIEMLSFGLESAGHQVATASSGEAALSYLRDNPCRMVITDWEMPGMSGVELCRHIRAHALDRYVYVILLTSRDSIDDSIAGLEAGADDFVTKPFHPTELLMRVRAGERVLGLETRDLAIFVMAKLADSRDPETGAHLERVRSYSRLLAAELAGRPAYAATVTSEFTHLIYLTSPLHDIGKVAIPDAILLKRGRLDAAEYETMKTHTLRGAETLEAALAQHPEAAFLRMARDIAVGHHERFDGTGYPYGLSGEAIPLAARIVSLADTYDAITQARVYKGARSHEQAAAIIKAESGRQFDPEVVSAFVGCEGRFDAILREYHDPVLA